MRSPALVGLVMALAIALACPHALASPVDQIHVDIDPLASGKAKYSGSIESRNRDCEARRTVFISTRRARLVTTKTNATGKFAEKGKAPRRGEKLEVKVPAKGVCPKLTGTSVAG